MNTDVITIFAFKKTSISVFCIVVFTDTLKLVIQVSFRELFEGT